MRETFVSPESTIRSVLEVLNASSFHVALVVNDDTSLLGTITDGDIRRGLLRGIGVDHPAVDVMNRDFCYAKVDDSEDRLLDLMLIHGIKNIPVLDQAGRVVRLVKEHHSIETTSLANAVVIMAGGRGKRLMPLTEDCPKPMLKVNGKPMLEILIEQCIQSGFKRFYLSVNYLKEQIINYFGDGSRWGVSIDYLIEDKPLGTAGSLSLIGNRESRSFLVMNGDVLTRLNPADLIHYHESQDCMATLCVREYESTSPFGVIEVSDNCLSAIKEKPTYQYLVNAGVYVLKPEALSLIPQDQFYDMPDLIQQLQSLQNKVAVCPIHEYWIDVGRPETLQQAHATWTSN